jgi:hypothetical protein
MKNKGKALVMIADLIVIGILSYLFVNLVTIPLVSPESGFYTNDRTPELAWGGMQGEFVLMVDDDPDFGSPMERRVSGNSYIFENSLDFGTYYWKVKFGGISSWTRDFTVGSSVVLARDDEGVRNEGNTEIMVTTDRVTGMLVGVGDSLEVEEDENVRAEQA